MSGKSRYSGGFGSGSRHYTTDIAADEPRITAATTAVKVATDAAVQASWAQYVQNLVSEQMAVIHDGVIAGLREGINEHLDRLFDRTNKLLRRELDVNSAKLEAALADLRAARAEMREEIRTELRAEIAERTALIKQPADGARVRAAKKASRVRCRWSSRTSQAASIIAATWWPIRPAAIRPSAIPQKRLVWRAKIGPARRDPVQTARMVVQSGPEVPMIPQKPTSGST
jgi:hypothetical protein